MPLRLIGRTDRLPRGAGLLIKAAANLRGNRHRKCVPGQVLATADQIAGHLLGVPKGAGLSHPHALDVQFPAVLPALGANVVGLHWSHPSGRHFMCSMVSPTTPAEISW